jgi:hypothetical protein
MMGRISVFIPMVIASAAKQSVSGYEPQARLLRFARKDNPVSGMA